MFASLRSKWKRCFDSLVNGICIQSRWWERIRNHKAKVFLFFIWWRVLCHFVPIYGAVWSSHISVISICINCPRFCLHLSRGHRGIYRHFFIYNSMYMFGILFMTERTLSSVVVVSQTRFVYLWVGEQMILCDYQLIASFSVNYVVSKSISFRCLYIYRCRVVVFIQFLFIWLTTITFVSRYAVMFVAGAIIKSSASIGVYYYSDDD